jgi:hypothetical protein
LQGRVLQEAVACVGRCFRDDAHAKALLSLNPNPGQATGKYRTTLRSARQVLLGQAIIALVLGGVLSGEPEAAIVSGNVPPKLDGRRAVAGCARPPPLPACCCCGRCRTWSAVGAQLHTMLGWCAPCHGAVPKSSRTVRPQRSSGRHDRLQAGSATRGQSRVPSRDMSIRLFFHIMQWAAWRGCM